MASIHKRKIAVVTGSRAEYGLLFLVIKGIHDNPDLELQLLVTGAHLMSQYGLTVKDIERDGFPIAARINLDITLDTPSMVAHAIAQGVKGFSDSYERLKPDLIVVLGDRFEIFAAVSAAVPFRIPVAHISGGETTLGAIDDIFRHAMTKMSHFHFPSTKKYAERIIQMGEDPHRVFCVGALGVDNILRLPLLSRETLTQELDIPLEKLWGVVTYHPVTLQPDRAHLYIDALLTALNAFPEVYWIIGLPNNDPGNHVIRERIETYKAAHANVRATVSLGQAWYLSLLQYASVMVGNSSSGFTEALSFRLPVVNVGIRQEGRIRTGNIIDVPDGDRKAIIVAIRRVLSSAFRAALQGLDNPYGDGKANERIVSTLATIDLEALVFKRFYDLVK